MVEADLAAAFTEAVSFTAGAFHGGFANHGFVSDRSFNFGVGFVMIMTASSVIDFVFVNPGTGYYDPHYIGSYDYDYPYDDYTASDYSDVILAVQRALAQLGYYHGPVDGVVRPQTQEAIRWFQSADSLPVTGEIDSRHAESVANRLIVESATSLSACRSTSVEQRLSRP